MSEWASVHADRFSSAEDIDDSFACERCGKVVEGDDLYEVKSDLAANKGADILVCYACWKSIQSEPAQPVSVPEPDEYGYWTRRPDGGLHYYAYDPATEDDELADHLIDSGDIPGDAPVTCHRCGAVVDGDALKVQTAADGTPRLGSYLCRAHLEAFAERLTAAIREQREGGA